MLLKIRPPANGLIQLIMNLVNMITAITVITIKSKSDSNEKYILLQQFLEE